MEERFLKNNAEWLDTSISFQTREGMETPEKKRGRPKISFESSSEQTKRLKTKELRDATPVNILNYATQMGLRATGQAQASKVLKSQALVQNVQVNIEKHTQSQSRNKLCQLKML